MFNKWYNIIDSSNFFETEKVLIKGKKYFNNYGGRNVKDKKRYYSSSGIFDRSLYLRL